MQLPVGILTFAGALAASIALVGFVRQYALRRDVLDHPGERSSHSTPTPRGGGAGLLAAWLLVLVPSLSAGWRGTWAVAPVLCRCGPCRSHRLDR
jgi:Fuc2NAc and GlcNAc transferase